LRHFSLQVLRRCHTITHETDVSKYMDKFDEAFRAVPRTGFLPAEMKAMAELDAPLPIGYGQTNSQPSTVHMMLEWLDPCSNEKVLDVGSGSGWTTALLTHLVGPKGMVYAAEKIPELVQFGAKNVMRAGIQNARFFEAKNDIGLPEFAPYDRILVSASSDTFPQKLLNQLKIGGRLVIPVKNSVYVVNRRGKNKYEKTEHPGFAFVPLV
jgi:protein-L-isoaspartate(D-aspartate) O-methyltransferase